MRKKYAIISIALLAILLLGLVGCGSGADQQTPPENNTSSEPPKQQSEPNQAEAKSDGSNDLVCSLAELPGLAESPDKGFNVDIVKAIDEVYTEGNIKIEVYPFARSVDNVISGKADFHLPTLRNLANDPSPAFVVDPSKNPFGTVTKNVGKLSFVIYSNVEKKITKEDLKAATAKGGTFPYKIEASGGLESNVPFPVIASNDLKQSLEKVANKRTDGVVWAQEEVDMIIKQLKLKTIFRSKWGDFEDAIAIPKGERGSKVDKILTECLKKLEESGRLQELHSKVHKPYDDWQPSQMGW